jgi:hypothetical protein
LGGEKAGYMNRALAGMRRQRSLLLALAICGAFATFALATLPPPYDFTGPWSGTVTSQKTGETGTLTADFTATAKARRFTGTTTLAVQGQTLSCPFTAKYRKNLILHPHCAGRPASAIHIHFDPVALTLTGSFPIGHNHPDVLSFLLVRAPA